MWKVFSTPSNINGFLMGPLTRVQYLYDNVTTYKNIKFKFKLDYFDIQMRDYVLVRNAEGSDKDWKGINSMVSDIVSKMPDSMRSSKPEHVNKLKGNLIKDLQDQLTESLNQYKEPSGSLGYLSGALTDENANEFMEIIDQKILKVESFIKQNFLLYLARNELATPTSQLMILTSELSKEVERGIRFCGDNISNRDLYETLSSMRPYNKFSNKVFNDLNSRMSPRNLFDFALTSTIGVSITRYVDLDEYLGMVSTVINESIPLLFSKSTDIFNFDEIIKHLKLDESDLISDEVANKKISDEEKSIEILLKSVPLKERRRKLTKFQEGLPTKSNLERRFINFLVKVLEVHIFKNHKTWLEDARKYILHQVDIAPFSVVMPEKNSN